MPQIFQGHNVSLTTLVPFFLCSDWITGCFFFFFSHVSSCVFGSPTLTMIGYRLSHSGPLSWPVGWGLSGWLAAESPYATVGVYLPAFPIPWFLLSLALSSGMDWGCC